MLTKELRDAQVAVELPAREMLAFFNYSNVAIGQSNFSLQLGLANVQGVQSNAAGVVVVQS